MPIQETNLTKKFEQKIRAHVPSNEITGADYKPVYEDTKQRMENMFGKKPAKHWPNTPSSCSKCYSVTPAVTE